VTSLTVKSKPSCTAGRWSLPHRTARSIA
jgi:hypothetical protein